MQTNSIFESIEKAIEKRGELSPFLFLWNNLELTHGDIEVFIQEIFQKHSIDAQGLFHLMDNGESLKIDEVKKIVAQWDIRPRFAFQIFFIENISRMTTQAANACLKFFEEPGEGNIIFLTSASESGILDTILSRVQICELHKNSLREENTFYLSMIASHISASSDELVRYFFSWKYEKQEYVEFLKSLVTYIAKSWDFIDLLDDIHEDIWGILKNNLQGKYVTDKYITLLKD